MSKIGFIGLGIMGNPMARNMVTKGSELLVFDIAEAAVNGLVEAGAKAATLKEIGESCDVIFTILPNGSIVKDTLFKETGVASSIKPGTIVVDMSSVTPVESRYCYENLKKLGVSFLDAPVSGGEPKAIDGTLSFMVGGDEDAFKAAHPFMMQMGANAVLVGGSGSGSVTKLANQIIVNLNISALGEALVFAMKAGVDPEKVFQAIRGGLAGSVVMEAKAPMIMNRNFNPGGKLSINHKDIKNVVNTAHELDIPVPMSAQLFEVMQGLKVRGLMDDDHGAIVKHFELLAGVEVTKGGE
ncbi:2-hydroxy-3-oxopropionate reductase [Youngiibacter fragilis]|uniref:Tartronate semialdehyde reductase n=1 Tax=Youngiibacter fragilis 232.1 TaxID=994573 RepID=V7I4A4_9CLOT|nr:2-hydroxy-3-oxopropionate reductase [Youngiibacter fragilis]ETA80703.1 tartronate semialdehyde reductase [Youngiibacter fragilis 232.1]